MSLQKTEDIVLAAKERPPLVTAIIPTYNRLALLLEAIDSVRSQTLPFWELVIVDDGSTDGTAEAITNLNDRRIRVLSLQHIGLMGVLRNEGAAVANGKWLAFLDSDDLWLKDKLERQVRKLDEDSRRWNYGGSQLIDKDRLVLSEKNNGRIVGGWIAKEVIKGELDFSASSIIVERNLFEKLGGFSADPRLFYREDFEFTLRLALNAEASVVEETVALIREHSGRSSKFLDRANLRSADMYRFCLEYHLSDPIHRKLAKRQRARLLAEACVDSLSGGKTKEGIRQLWSALINGDKYRHILSALIRGVLNRTATWRKKI